jgi:hypothetical protein
LFTKCKIVAIVKNTNTNTKNKITINVLTAKKQQKKKTVQVIGQIVGNNERTPKRKRKNILRNENESISRA